MFCGTPATSYALIAEQFCRSSMVEDLLDRIMSTSPAKGGTWLTYNSRHEKKKKVQSSFKKRFFQKDKRANRPEEKEDQKGFVPFAFCLRGLSLLCWTLWVHPDSFLVAGEKESGERIQNVAGRNGRFGN